MTYLLSLMRLRMLVMLASPILIRLRTKSVPFIKKLNNLALSLIFNIRSTLKKKLNYKVDHIYIKNLNEYFLFKKIQNKIYEKIKI